MGKTDNVMRFINVIDRYLGVSYVYSQRIKEGKADKDKSSDRLQRLIKLLEAADIQEDGESLKPVNQDDIKGQNVIASKEVFEQTKCYQNVIKERLCSDIDSYNKLSSQNQNLLKDLINMEPEKCLASFKTVSYAWDILTEFASLSLLPSSEKLAATDMIHMHIIELRQHLFKVMAHAKMLSPNSALELRGHFTVNQLNDWEKKGKLIESIVTESIHMDIGRLMDEIHSYTKTYPEIFQIIASNEEQAVFRLQQESRGYPDILEEDINMRKAESICDNMVLYGLGVGYIVWLLFAEEDEISYHILFKHCLFCTRTLLEEERWKICKGIAELGLKIIERHNKDGNKLQIQPYMMQANLFYAKKKLNENIQTQLQIWDIEDAHERYKFLQLVLLEDYQKALDIAKRLLDKDINGKPNMSFSEFKEWPILASFRESCYWDDFSRYACEREEQGI